jgi:hypothetical protein
MTKGTRWIFCFIVIFAIVGGLAYYSTLSKRVMIPDVSQPWQQRFSNPIGGHLSGRLRIELSGHLDAPARLYYAGAPVHLPAGTINHAIDEPEYWGSTCILRYEPLGVASGSLAIRVIIGSCPDWTYHRPVVGDPEPAGYTGGWITYHPGSNTPSCRAAYHGGKRHGEWQYFDHGGRLLRTEQWQDGIQIR